jgi:hypothetical protein
MKITRIDYYLDGGTIKIYTDAGEFCIDYRLGTRTPGVLYPGYPQDTSIPVDPTELIAALKQASYINGAADAARRLEKLITRPG